MCFGEFAVTDPISSLEWYGENPTSILKFYGLVGILVVVVSCFAMLAFRLYVKTVTRSRVRDCLKQLSEEEAQWKQKRLEIVQASNGQDTTEYGPGVRAPKCHGSGSDVTFVKSVESQESQEPAQKEDQEDVLEGPAIPSSETERPNTLRTEGASTEQPPNPEVAAILASDDALASPTSVTPESAQPQPTRGASNESPAQQLSPAIDGSAKKMELPNTISSP